MLIFIHNSLNHCCCFQTGGQLPEILAINCTSLSSTSEIFNKVKIHHDIDRHMHRLICNQHNAQKLVPLQILEKIQPHKKLNARSTSLRQLQQLGSQKQQTPGMKMM